MVGQKLSVKIVCFIEADVKYTENLHEPHSDLQFLTKMNKIDKVRKTCS